LNVDANEVIAKLGEQIKQLSYQVAVKDCLIEMLQKEFDDLKKTQS
jgi:hypothetical protein